jgi:hypothetical protein
MDTWRMIALAAIVAVHCTSGFGQTVEQPVFLNIEVANYVTYRGDITDSNKLARDPGVTSPLPARAFQYTHNIGDIVSINGKPAKGLQAARIAALSTSVNPQPGQMIADFNGGGGMFCVWEILGADGNWIGTLVDGGSGVAPGHTITAGHGAFFGVIGEHRMEMMSSIRVASVTEDPANRRIHGGGRFRFFFRLYPKYRPAVDVTPAGPSVFHADFSPVTATSPAHAGEVLIIAARNLGPTRPDRLPPGSRPFKADPLEEVNSPVEVAVNGNEVEVINKVGWPGTSDLYRVDFRVPSGLVPGMASIQISAAWIPGPEVKIPVQ